MLWNQWRLRSDNDYDDGINDYDECNLGVTKLT